MNLLDHGTVTARKPRTCSLCSAQIHKGEKHYVQKLVVDGHHYRWRECPDCVTDDVHQFVADMFETPQDPISSDAAIDWAWEVSRHPNNYPADEVTAARAMCDRSRTAAAARATL